MKKYLEISQGIEEAPVEGFYSLEEAHAAINEILSEEPRSHGTCITLSEAKPIKNADLIANPSLVQTDQDSFSIMVFGRSIYTVNNRVETEGYFETSDKREYNLNEIKQIVSDVYEGNEAWKSLFTLDRKELNVDHALHAKMVRSVEETRVEEETKSSNLHIPLIGMAFIILVVIAILLIKK